MLSKRSILQFFENDWHFLLLIIFFITHGYAENKGLVPVAQLLLLFVVLAAGAVLLFWLCKKIFRNRHKAALFVSLFLVVFLFFGALQDFFGQFRFTSASAQLKVFFPASLVVILLGFIFLKRTRRRLERLRVFLNVLLVIYILIDVITLLLPAPDNNKSLAVRGLNASTCDTCSKPCIYFILLDEYSGSGALKTLFNYDNTAFEQFLQQQQFKVNRNTHSNYVFTVFSVASTLNMEYLQDLGQQSDKNHFGYRKATMHISENIVTQFLREQGYSINNLSYFPLPGAPAEFKSDYLPGRISLITHKTMYSRVIKELVLVLASRYSIHYFQEKYDEFYINNNEAILQQALREAQRNNAQDNAGSYAAPSFNYLHLMLPHYPFAYDSTGRRIVPFWKRKSFTMEEVDKAYVQYLAYANKRLQQFITELQQRTAGKAIIMLLSDHGYRSNRPQKDKTLPYQTINAIYLPQKNYGAWYDGITNVNQFRALLNTSFGQKLPMLKDSLVD
jgi:hypothetical protein